MISPRRIYRRRSNFMALYLGGGGGLHAWGIIFERKNTSVCNLLKLLFFVFCCIKHIFQYFSPHARCEIFSKLTIKTPEYIKLTIKLKNKDTIDVVLASLLLTLNTFQLQCFCCWLWSVNFQLGLLLLCVC